MIKLRKKAKIRDYIGFNKVKIPDYLKWFGATLLLLLILEIPAYLFKYNFVSDTELEEFKNINSITIYLISIVIFVPILEEILIRGFLFKGLLYSRIGQIGTIMFSSLIGVYFTYNMTML